MSADGLTDSELDQKSHLLLVLMRPDFIMLIIQHRGRKHYYQIAVLLLYMLATTALILAILIYDQEGLGLFAVVLNDSITSEPVQSHDLMFENLEIAEAVIYVVANTIADALLLYRCYVVWGGRKHVIAVPSLVCFVNTVLALSAVVLKQKSIATLITGENSLLTPTTSGIALSFLAVGSFVLQLKTLLMGYFSG
ncbi:hypothetical protein BDP27DRAFT_1425356 [Rhodocollybia butyracea]|uniref:Uncharacterized protein n=1 Tax=Rhodocollybia butyracea TaxID=206335 RepID=A0A9P5PFT7_9AGAR|nr:hypothetical protein BDP27DRAFT_1425356 [Rhodocollybia butyracea]